MIKPTKSWKNTNTHYIEAIDSEWYKSLVEFQNALTFFTYDFYRKKDMKTMYLPVTTNSISSPMGLGSDSLPVEIELFGQKTYLADSMQFMLEYGCRYFKEGCFYLMPSFRGEKADQRHLCQFYHSEAEIIGDLQDIMFLVEEYLVYLAEAFLENYKDKILEIAGTVDHIKKVISIDHFPQVLYDDAIDMLKARPNCLRTNSEGITFITSNGEQELIRNYDGAVWLTHMDKRVVPFYQSIDSNGTTAKCADLLFGMGEVVGAGERHKNGVEVTKALEEHFVLEREYIWYIEMKNKFPLRTSGFGMGTERYLLWLLQQNDIRDLQLLPRFNGEIIIP